MWAIPPFQIVWAGRGPEHTETQAITPPPRGGLLCGYPEIKQFKGPYGIRTGPCHPQLWSTYMWGKQQQESQMGGGGRIFHDG